MHTSIRSVVLCCGVLFANAAAPHEFWIEAQGGSTASIRVGQMLAGASLPYLDRTIRAARHVGPDGDIPLTGRQGDLPALSVDLGAPGFHVLRVETEPAYVVFADLTEFADYLAYEGLQEIERQHRLRDLPTRDIAEEYWRHAKTLIQVGPLGADDVDAAVGLRYELVAMSSPFAARSGQLELQLLWEGQPEPGVQVALFFKAATEPGGVTRQLLRSDASGRVRAEVSAAGTYLFNAVHMIPVDGPGSVAWQSHWASLSFVLPSN